MYFIEEKKMIENFLCKKAPNPMQTAQNEAYQRRLTQLENENSQRRNAVSE